MRLTRPSHTPATTRLGGCEPARAPLRPVPGGHDRPQSPRAAGASVEAARLRIESKHVLGAAGNEQAVSLSPAGLQVRESRRDLLTLPRRPDEPFDGGPGRKGEYRRNKEGGERQRKPGEARPECRAAGSEQDADRGDEEEREPQAERILVQGGRDEREHAREDQDAETGRAPSPGRERTRDDEQADQREDRPRRRERLPSNSAPVPANQRRSSREVGGNGIA